MISVSLDLVGESFFRLLGKSQVHHPVAQLPLQDPRQSNAISDGSPKKTAGLDM